MTEQVDDAKIVAAYDGACAQGYVRVGDRAHGAAATLAAAQALGMTSSTAVWDALKRQSHPDIVAWETRVAESVRRPRGGRPRKDGPRLSDGRLSRATLKGRSSAAAIAAALTMRQVQDDEKRSGPKPAELVRIRDAIRRFVGDKPSAWASAAGADFIAGTISDLMFAEASRIFEVRADHLAALGVGASPRSVDLEPGHKGEGVDVETEAGDAEARRHRRAVERGEALLIELDEASLRLADPAWQNRRPYALASQGRYSTLRYCCEPYAPGVDCERGRLVLSEVIRARLDGEAAARRLERRSRRRAAS